jgi:RIO kinase 3
VCNDLKVHSYKEQKVSKKVRDKVDKSTTVMAVDARTRLMLYKLVNLGAVAEVQGTISTGKESVVIYAKGGQMKDRAVPSECAIKVFKTSLNEFKRREEYILGDHRLPSRGTVGRNLLIWGWD